ncbi:MAG: WG repeat-containing protein [Clostridiales Family XIII bacterium]|jgi:hypothetical protein|nr:WG repeat-containing protein [Clostridiales Family XIII bacterium]
MKARNRAAAILSLFIAACGAAAAPGFAADDETPASQFAPGDLYLAGYDNGLRDVYVRMGDDYVHGCINEEGNIIVAPTKNGPYVGMTNGLALINEGARDANGRFIPEEAKCSALNTEGERVRVFENHITWYDGRHGIAAISAPDPPGSLLYALTDESGKPLTAFEFETLIHPEESSPDVFWGQKDGLWGCIKADGSVKLPFAYRGFRGYSNGSSPSSLGGIVTPEGKEGLVTNDGDIVIPPVYRAVFGMYDGIAAVMNEEGKYAYFDAAGKNLTGFVYGRQAFSFAEGLARLYEEEGENPLFGFIDRSFQWVLPPAYTGFAEGSGYNKPGHMYVYDKDGVGMFIENPLQYTYKIKIYVDGNWIYTEQEAFIESGRTLVPFRKVAEGMGWTVRWIPDRREIELANGTRSVRMVIGDGHAAVNVFDDGLPPETVELDVPPRIVDGRTYVPLRFIAESCGAMVEWDEASSTIRITTDAGSGAESD